MISALRKNRKILTIVSGVIILLLVLSSVGYMGYYSASGALANGTVAIVGKDKVKRNLYDNLVNLQLKELGGRGADTEDPAVRQYVQQAVLASEVRELALAQRAEQAGLGVSDYQIGYNINKMFSAGGTFNKNAYVAYIRENYHMLPEDFEEMMERGETASLYNSLIPAVFKATPDELAFGYQTQTGSMKDYDTSKALFAPTVLETKTQQAQRFFYDNFYKTTEVKQYSLDQTK